MNALAIIINIVLILVSIVLIIAVLMQQGQRQGLGAIAGGAETFFGKGKAQGFEAKLAKITKIGAIVFIILAIVMTFISKNFIEENATLSTNDALTQLSEAIANMPAADETVEGTETADELPAVTETADEAVVDTADEAVVDETADEAAAE